VADHLEARLRRIQEDYVQALPARIAELVGAWDDGQPAEARLAQARQLAHRLAGGAGTLGQPALGAASKALELDLQAWLESGRAVDAEALADFRRRSADLAGLIQAPS